MHRLLPLSAVKAGDIGDVPFRSRYSLDDSIADIEALFTRIAAAGVTPLAVGGDHSITYPILKALGAKRPVGLVHIDAHCDTGGPFEGAKFHHGGPFRNAVLAGVLDPERTIQIGIRGGAEYLWEFSYDSGMTVIHAEEFARLGDRQVRREDRTRWWATARPTSPSTSTASTPPSRRAPARPRSAASPPARPWSCSAAAPASTSSAATWSRWPRSTTPPPTPPRPRAQMLFEILALVALRRGKRV